MLKLSLAAALLAGAAAHTRSTFDAVEFAAVGRSMPSALMTFTAALPARNVSRAPSDGRAPAAGGDAR